MRLAAEHRFETAARTEAAPLASGCFIGKYLRDIQIITAHAEVFLRVRHSRLQQFQHRFTCAFIGKAQSLKRFIGAHAAHHVNDEAHLLCRLRQEIEFSLDIVCHDFVSAGVAAGAAVAFSAAAAAV